MPNVLIIRPLEDAFPLAAILKTKTIESLLCPLYEPIFLPFPSFERIQALIVTSKNALRAIETYQDFKEIPLYTVGDQTAALGHKMGFTNILSASGTSQELISLILNYANPHIGTLYHLSGERIKRDIVQTLQSKGLQAKRHIVYKIQPIKNLPLALSSALQNQKISHVMFFSPHTTSIFVNLIKKEGLEKTIQQITSLCLSQDVAEQASYLSWRKIWISPQPTTENMTGYFDEKK